MRGHRDQLGGHTISWWPRESNGWSWGSVGWPVGALEGQLLGHIGKRGEKEEEAIGQ